MKPAPVYSRSKINVNEKHQKILHQTLPGKIQEFHFANLCEMQIEMNQR